MSFRREKFVPKGGPDGGNGGRGGHVILEADPNRHSLLDLRIQKIVRAGRGEHGLGSQCYGKNGEDRTVPVPLGTQVWDDTNATLLADLSLPHQRFIVARGGRGGRGNMAFKSSTRQAPRHSEKGQVGQNREVRLELKLLADVGLVGLPNAGKSTLLSVITAAKPRIADYPFTTLTPNLGVVRLQNHTSAVIADIPGLIEGAHAGAGLGDQFLRHIERTEILIHLISGDQPDFIESYALIRAELEKHNPVLLQKMELVAITKADIALGLPHFCENLDRLARHLTFKPHVISALSGEGIAELTHSIADAQSQGSEIESAL